LKLVDTTGGDMNGTFFFVRQINSPLPNETWLLTWGGVTGSNGFGVFIARVYAFDGQAFRTVWKPNDFTGATANVTQTGFTIKHIDRERAGQGGIFVEDQYSVAPDRVQMIKSTRVVE
jgi:hypothetical protein